MIKPIVTSESPARDPKWPKPIFLTSWEETHENITFIGHRNRLDYYVAHMDPTRHGGAVNKDGNAISYLYGIDENGGLVVCLNFNLNIEFMLDDESSD